MQEIEAGFNKIEHLLFTAIRQEGILSFARFMEIALYYPGLGYYERDFNPIGRQGDYYTSVSAGSLFGELLAHQFMSWNSEIGAQELNIMEAGAHDGQLALDIISCLVGCGRSKCRYALLEPSTLRARKQRAKLSAHGDKVEWISNWQTVPKGSYCGVIFSNELLDAFPVNRLRWNISSKKWQEWGIELRNERLQWATLPKTEMVSESLLAEVLGNENMPERQLLSVLPDGFTVDISPVAVHWWHEAAQRLQKGYLVAFDYGLEIEELFAPQRYHGTLRAYYRHQLASEVFERPGFQDITASVIFPSIKRAGERAGLKTVYYEPQSRYVMRLVQQIMQEKGERWLRERSGQIKTLIHPDHLGRAFRVLVQVKDVKEGQLPI